MINTVTGVIAPEQLGLTLMHEHFFFGYPGFQADDDAEHVSRDEVISFCVDEAKALVANGVKTVIDATTNDCGRDVEMLQEISLKSGLQIICCTGFFNSHMSGKGYWNERAAITDVVKELSELMIKEYTVGIRRTGIKSGFIKIVTSPEPDISEYEKRFIKAAVIAQKETGAVITTHTSGITDAFNQAKLFLELGADPEKIVIGHMDNYVLASQHKALVDMGFNIAFDRVGQVYCGPPDNVRLTVLADLLAYGCEDHIVMSHDNIGIKLGRRFTWPEEFKESIEDFNKLCIFKKFIPQMLNSGVTKQQIDKIFIENPKRIFS